MSEGESILFECEAFLGKFPFQVSEGAETTEAEKLHGKLDCSQGTFLRITQLMAVPGVANLEMRENAVSILERRYNISLLFLNKCLYSNVIVLQVQMNPIEHPVVIPPSTMSRSSTGGTQLLTIATGKKSAPGDASDTGEADEDGDEGKDDESDGDEVVVNPVVGNVSPPSRESEIDKSLVKCCDDMVALLKERNEINENGIESAGFLLCTHETGRGLHIYTSDTSGRTNSNNILSRIYEAMVGNSGILTRQSRSRPVSLEAARQVLRQAQSQSNPEPVLSSSTSSSSSSSVV